MDQYKRDSNALLDEVIALSIETEGAIGRDEAWYMCSNERQRVALYLEKRAKARALANKQQ